MARKKRPYIPKVKARGIACSGFDVRFRFRDGFIPADRRAKRRNPSRLRSDTPAENSNGSFQTISTHIEDSDGCRFSDIDDAVETHTTELENLDNVQISEFITSPNVLLGPYFLDGNNGGGTYPAAVDMTRLTYWRSTPGAQGLTTMQLSQAPDLAILEPWKEFLLTYFSDNIAPEMVVVDDDHNGWRHLVLPLACVDELVMSSVLAVSAFHLAGKVSGQVVVDPSKLYCQAIRELQNRRDLTGCDKQTRQLIILAIVILLVAVMVNGCSDFPIMFQMLQSAIDAVGGEAGLLDGGEMAEFSLRQIRKMRVYAAPLLSQGDGVYAIICQAQESFDCLHYYDRLYPKHSPTFSLIADLRQQAFNIYLDRVLDGCTSTPSTEVIHHFMATVKSFPEGSPGEHVLVWPVFIAASESSLPEHHIFFEKPSEKDLDKKHF
ncbi:Fc.00g034490.m01.CDS01 [Cosmosporella sp. VM-42]